MEHPLPRRRFYFKFKKKSLSLDENILIAYYFIENETISTI